jgi:hypothetical protein
MRLSSFIKRWFGKPQGTIGNSRPGPIQTRKHIGGHKSVKPMFEILEDRLTPATVSVIGTALYLAADAGESLTVAPSSGGVQITSNLGLTQNGNSLANPYTIPAGTTTFHAYLANTQGQADTLKFGLGNNTSITDVQIGANPNPGTTPAPGTVIAVDSYDSVTLTTTKLSTTSSAFSVTAGTINFFGSTFVPYVGTVSVQPSGTAGEYIITPASGQDWTNLGFTQGYTVTLTGVSGTESGNAKSAGLIPVGFNATFSGATCKIANIVGDSLYVNSITPLNLSYSYYDKDTNTAISVPNPSGWSPTSGPSLTSQSDTGATVSANTSSAQVQAFNMTLTSPNSLTVQSTGAPYLGSVTINAAPLANQPYAGDSYLTGPDWGAYFYAPGQVVSFTDANGTAQSGTVAAIVGDNLYLVMSASPATGTNANDTVQCTGFTPQVSVKNLLSLNVTGQGSILGAMDVYGTLSANTKNGNITIQDVDLGGQRLALGELNAGSGTIKLAAVGSIVNGVPETPAHALADDNANLVAGAVDLMTTGTGSSIGAITTGSAAGTVAAYLILSTNVGRLTATTNDGDVFIQNGSSALTIDSVVANQGGQAPTVNQDRIVYNSSPGSGTPTYSPGTSLVQITSAGPILLNSISATGDVTITGEYIVEGNGQSQSIIAPSVELNATGAANYEGQVTFAGGTSTSGDTLTLPSTGPTWSALGFATATAMAGDPIVIAGASDTANNGTFTIASVSDRTLTLQQSFVLDPETELDVTVGDGMIGLPSTVSSNAAIGAIDLSEVATFSAQTTNGSIYLALGNGVDSTAASVTAGGTGNVAVRSAANFLTVENITALGAGTMLAPGQVLKPGDSLSSFNNGFKLVFQTDGNLVWYDQATGQALWASNTSGMTVTQAIMQTDGNLVLYNGTTAVWATNTSGNPGAYLALQNDGNLVIYSARGAALWSSGTYGAAGASPLMLLGGNVAVAVQNGALIEYPSSDGSAGIISGQNVSVTSSLSIGSVSYPLLTNATAGLAVTASATSPSSAAVYVNNVSKLKDVTVSTYDGSVTINDNEDKATGAFTNLLSFNNNLVGPNVLSENGSAVVTFSNTDANDGSNDNVVLAGTIHAGDISAGGQILASTTNAPTIDGLMVMLSAGSGIGLPGTPINTQVTGLVATTTTGSAYINQPTAGTAVTVAFTASNGSITSVTPKPVSGGSGYPANSTFYLSVGGGTGGIIQATTNSAGNITLAASPIAGGTGYSTSTSGAPTSAMLFLSATTSNGNINVTAAGDIDLIDQTLAAPNGQGSNIQASAISTNAGGTVTLAAPNGSIYNPSNVTGNIPTVTAGTLNLKANEVGTASNSLETSISSLMASSVFRNGLFLNNNEPLTVASRIDGGDLSISTIGNLTLDGPVSGNNVDLTATAGALTATTTTTTGGKTTTKVNNGVEIKAEGTLTMSAEQIGDSSAYSPAGSGYQATDFIQTNARTINAMANFGGIYISNSSSTPLTLTAAAIGPTPGGTVTNNIEVYSRGSIILDPQTNALTALQGSQPVAVFNPGGPADLFAGHTVNADGTTGTTAPGFTIASALCLVSGLGTTAGLAPGMSVSGAGIPAGDVIAVVNPTGSHGDGEIELAYAPTAAASNVSLTFTSPSGKSATVTGDIHGTAPLASGRPSYFDVESGSWSQDVSNSDVNYGGKAPLVLTVNATEIVPPPPGGGASGSVEVITERQLEQGSGAYNPIAGSIIIENDMDTSGPATVNITGPLSLTATNGPIVFLNPNDTLDVTGDITINADTVAVLGNLNTHGGDLNVTTVGNITIGTVDAGSGTVTLTSTAGNVFSSNGGSGTNALQITAGTTNVNSAGHPASASQSASLVELNATQAIATANAASAQAAADQTTASAFLSALTSINSQLKSIQSTVASDRQIYQFDVQATNQASSTVTTDSNKVTAESWAYDGLSAAANALSLTAAILQQIGTSTEDTLLPVAEVWGTVAILPAVTEQVVAAGFSLSSAIINVAASGVSFALTADSNTLSTDAGTLADAQAAQAQAYVQLQADLSTQTALTDTYDAILQAYNTATQAAANEKTIAMQDQVVSAQAIAAVVATATPQPMTVSGQLNMTDQANGTTGSGIAITTPIMSSATTGLPGATIQSNSPLTVSANITFPGPIALTAQPESSSETGDDLTVASGVTIQSTGSSVSLAAGNNVVVPAGATIDAGSTSTITITGDGNDDGGANITVNGTLVAQSALIGVDANSPGNDTFNITPSATTPITVTGGKGTNTLTLDAGGLAVSISGNTITTAGMQPVTFTNIEIVKITNRAGGGSFTLTGLSGQANTMSLVGTGQGAGTATLNGVAISFGGMANFIYQGGGAGDTITVTPFATSVLGWNLAVTVAGGSGTPASLTYDSVGSLADTVTATGQYAGSIASQGLAVVQFSNVNAITTNASQSPGAQLAVNLPRRSSPDAANLLSVGNGTADIDFGLFGVNVDTADYAALTINGNTVGSNKLDLVTSAGAALSMPLTLNYPGMHGVVNTGAASSVAASASGDVIGVTSAGVVEVTDLFGNDSEFAVTDTQLVFSDLGNKETINIAGNNPFTNGIDVDGNASFTDVINYTAGANAAVTVTPGTSTVSQPGAGAVFFGGIKSVNLTAGGSASTLTVDGSAQAENFDFTPTAAGAGSFTTRLSAASGSTPTFTYTGIGNGITVNGGTSDSDQLSLTATPANGAINSLAADQTAAGTLAFTLNDFTVPFSLTNIGSVNLLETAGNALFEVGVAAALEQTPTASLNFHVVGGPIYNDYLLVKTEGSEPAGSHDVITPSAITGSGSVAVGALNPVTYQDIQSVKLLPTVTVTDAGGTYNGKPFVATAQVNGGASLNGVKPTLTYYSTSGTFTPTVNYYNSTFTPPPDAVRLAGAPIKAGTYAVVASFAGAGSYASNWAWTTFTISQVKTSVVVHAPKNVSVHPLLIKASPTPVNGSLSGTARSTVTVDVLPLAPAAGRPTGTVSFYDGSTLLGTAKLIGGVAKLIVTGKHTVTKVTYSGDANFLPYVLES